MLGQELHQVASGRVFARRVKGEPDIDTYARPAQDAHRFASAQMIIGLVEIPKRVQLECLHTVRLNSGLWMDIDQSRDATTSWMSRADLAESDASGLLRTLKFGAGVLPDTFEVFVRASMLEHDNPGMRWAYIFGAAAQQLQALPKDGLYEFDKARAGEGVRLVSADPHMGEAPRTILRKPLWGPGGAFGLAHSMEPSNYPTWVVMDRASNMKRDPMFAKFAARMEASHPLPMFYTAQQEAQRNAAADRILREVMLEADSENTEADSLSASAAPQRQRA